MKLSPMLHVNRGSLNGKPTIVLFAHVLENKTPFEINTCSITGEHLALYLRLTDKTALKLIAELRKLVRKKKYEK